MHAELCHPTFRFLQSRAVEALNIEVAEYEHIATGARHYHIASDYDENVFLVAFRTVPEDSRGVAHILEHTALCGSERYPVRDPFFMMTRRSLNTFMNAFTSSDWTAYPFASQNHKDFFNLLDVYLDATFFSRLDPLDFAQEGHRVEFEESGNSDSALVYKGVVYNEMKGAMSSPVSTLWQTLTRYLFPTTTYHHNSGGEPDAIPDLSYEDLLAFYRSHYHPSNAIFMTFGDLPVQTLQQRFEENALSRFERRDEVIAVADEKRYFAPVRVEEAYALAQEDQSQSTHHVLGWLLPRSIDLNELMQAHLLSRVLLDNSSSPLRAALESSSLGNAPSPLCGLEDSNREMSFMCGLEGSEPEHAEAFEALVLETLNTIAEEGVSQEMVAAQLHQLELSQREITGDGYPFGLQLILASMPAAIHRGNPIGVLDIDPALEILREKVKDPQFIPNLVRRWLLDNPHRVRLTLRPDAELADRRDTAEAARLEQIKSAMNAEQKQAVIERAEALEARQQQVDDDSILPCVTLEDVPAELHLPAPDALAQGPAATTWFSAGTNGLTYQQVIVDLPELGEHEQALLPLYTYCLTELGCAERDYRANQAYQSQITGGLHAYTSLRGCVSDEQQVSGYLVMSGKALSINSDKLTALMAETLEHARFDEQARIREIVAQQRARREQSITGSGHALAMMAAAAELAPVAHFSHLTRGLEGVRRVKQLDKRIQEEAELTKLATDLAVLHTRIKVAPRRFLLVAEEEHQQAILSQLTQYWSDQPEVTEFAPLVLPTTRSAVKQLWLTNTQVNFCACAFPTVPTGHPDAAALTVLGDFLRNGYLHRAIREKGGAYGAGAGQDNGDAVFRFFSYRDPRVEGTLEDFARAVDWLAECDNEQQRLQEAILGVIGSMDKPGSPAGEAKGTYHSSLFGRTPEVRQAFREQILAVTLDDLKRVAKHYLQPEHASVAVVTNQKVADTLPADFVRIEI
ncbi:insulinase family protein [Marinobacterium marinum]|uniref:Insulinase family protein n=1 Tax=Marinobacterium marinum TaxID=2756129 RepID=A0A7W1WXQ6_9GAMM|nr:insulinase family protein [Marinobacterium marinum]MBA4502111.1 insulinase family protein [Marinobacterium marinum]